MTFSAIPCAKSPTFRVISYSPPAPRRSKIHADPDTGLATVEALFAAICVLGRRDDSLLRLYPWRDAFLALNRDFVE